MEMITPEIRCHNLVKKFKGFTLDVPELVIPKGYCTALIGENGAGKTTLLNCLAGIRRDYTGEITYFGKYSDMDREKNPEVKENIGYTGPNLYFLPSWTIRQVKDLGGMLFDRFDANAFERILTEIGMTNDGKIEYSKKVSDLSSGNRMKLAMAFALARDTECLILDEPASPLDPLMRDKLCEMMRDYLVSRDGERTIFCSTHNVADMEQVTDYAIFLEHGKVVEQGFVEELKEKYIVVKGEEADVEKAKQILYSISVNRYGFEGICLAENLDKLAGMDIATEQPTLSQITVAIMKANTKLQG
ncbi:MAG: ABC transporter ATP-binding protein [Lachnospiraceae bacterium]|nr:ABC transporter ATP-binding protein [Lachnospiraceae bacterium]